MADAPRYRLIPPAGVGLPLATGLLLTWLVGDPVRLFVGSRATGAALLIAFIAWNGTAYILMTQHRTGILPGQQVTTLLTRGPFRVSRNPLYVGLVAAHVGIALLLPSVWALILAPLSAILLHWGAILPEEEFLAGKFGEEYKRYQARVRRWL